MKLIPDHSIDMILCDLPYGVTAYRWDSVIPLEPLWAEYRRILKPNGAIVLTGNDQFAATLICGNRPWYRYQWIWVKTTCTNFRRARRAPLRCHELVLVFYAKQPTFNPQGVKRLHSPRGYRGKARLLGAPLYRDGYRQHFTNYPKAVLKFASERKTSHPSQKPVALFEYMIRTYTNPGDLVLDNCMGSGTTAIACIKSGRRYIGFEADPTYFKQAQQRIRQHKTSHLRHPRGRGMAPKPKLPFDAANLPH